MASEKQQALQRQQQQLAIEKRNANIFDSVNILCMAGIQGSVISEISIRVYFFMENVQGEQRINFEQE